MKLELAPAAFAAIAGMFLISKLTKRGKDKRSSKPAPEVETPVPQLPKIEEEQDPSTIEANATLKRAASADPTASSEADEHKIKAMKVKEEISSPPATPLVLKPEVPEPEQAADEVESIPSPPFNVAAPPAASATVSSEFAVDSTKGSLFDEGESQADSQDSSLSRTGSLKRLGSKMKSQLTKLGSRSSKGSIQ